MASERLSTNKTSRTLRKTYLISAVAVIFWGLASRKYGQYLPLFLAENAGDALWAMMVYFGFRFLLARKNVQNSIFFSLLFSFVIEFSQLYQADWINQIRSTWLGALVLGKGFLTADLIRYTVGILIAAFLDLLLIRHYRSSK
ncbi:DUF2809 domain-containing protein [Bacillus sp. ISL-18]|uniref:ribosomal maturation YjgA family protein n=1 Tax=Bacillus sp. ISL-18 TaxID=2819118 RepID=UPI001BEBCAEE|nr:DUF2809 domain-containing protein [Bacillus sp. ISL-18]MBT2659023.1 DUF2809 domain-containing protein [Bacillus sp. ISL-18]